MIRERDLVNYINQNDFLGIMSGTIDKLVEVTRHPVTRFAGLLFGSISLYVVGTSFLPYQKNEGVAPVIESSGIYCRYAGFDHDKDGRLDEVTRRVPIGVGEFAMFKIEPASEVYQELQSKYSGK